jgi:hypothetical protein
MTPEEITAWVTTGKTALDLMKSAWQAMPKGEKRDALEEKVKKAETALESINVALAKSLGYKLCRCTFPPQIMLWKLSEGTNICSACGTKDPALFEGASGMWQIPS